MLLFDLLYFLIILLAVPFWIKYLFKEEYRKILRHRFVPGLPVSTEKRLWIHAVSVGEVKSLKNLIDTLTQQYPKLEIALSVTTPTGCDIAKKEYPKNKYKNIHVINSPIDFTFVIKKFIKTINPKLLILNELEIWPNWITIIKKKNIPTLLINGRISDRAFKRYYRHRWFLKRFFKKIDRFLVQAESYKERFQQLSIPSEKIHVSGNIKADQAFNCLATAPPEEDIFELLKIKDFHPKDKKILTLASSHADDEQFLVPLIPQIRQNYFTIIVPRHLKRLPEIQTLLETHHIRYATWSRVQTVPPHASVLIFDKMGALFQTLKISHIIFMGGTLDPRTGGHNLYEPAILGKPIVGGPCYNNFPTIGAELAEKNVYHTVHSPDDLLNFLQNTRHIDWNQLRQTAVETVNKRKGSLQCTLKEIQPLLN